LKTYYSRTSLNNNLRYNRRNDYIRNIIFKDDYFQKIQNRDFKLLVENNSDFNKNTINEFESINFNSNYFFKTKQKVDLNSFKILELIGKGSFGEVYLVENIFNKHKFAMKVLNKTKILSQNIVRYVKTERDVLSMLKHPYIVKLFYAFQTAVLFYLILVYCE